MGGVDVKLDSHLTLALEECKWSATCHGHSQGNRPSRRLGVPKSQSGHSEDQIYLFPLPRFKPQIVQSAPNRYTDWAIMAAHAHTRCFRVSTWEAEAEFCPVAAILIQNADIISTQTHDKNFFFLIHGLKNVGITLCDAKTQACSIFINDIQLWCMNSRKETQTVNHNWIFISCSVS